MAEVLELKVDKFVFRFPADLLFSEAGVWVRFEETGARIGLTDYTQLRNGDVTFVEMKPRGTEVPAGGELGTVETIKANLSVPSPAGGTISGINAALETSPELVNQDPYGRGWLAVIEVADVAAARRGLKTAPDHLELVRRLAEAETIR